jgi:uncharacterized protein (DUF1499 family)
MKRQKKYFLLNLVVFAASVVLLGACSGEPPSNLGVRNGRLALCPKSPNCVSSQAADKEHAIAPLTFSGSPTKAFDRLKKILAMRGDTKVIVDKAELSSLPAHTKLMPLWYKPDYLRVEFHTRLFVDDGEFLLGKDRIDIRSASRIGYSDFGKNRKRIEEIRKAFSASAGS